MDNMFKAVSEKEKAASNPKGARKSGQKKRKAEKDGS